MRYDLLHAQASVDWAVAELPSLNDRINAWLQFNLEVTIKDPDPNGSEQCHSSGRKGSVPARIQC